MQHGGQPETLIRLLSEHYRGYAQMANLMAGWLQLTGPTLELRNNVR